MVYQEALVSHTVRWGDLLSPRAVIQFTLEDAWNSLPTLLAMGGFFLVGIIVLLIGKKLLQYVFLSSYTHRWIISKFKKGENGKVTPYWMERPVHNYGTIMHLLITSLFLIGVGVLGIFTAAIGNINIWNSPLATVGIGLIGTYIFGTGLQQVGSYYFVLWFGGMTYQEYWSLVGSPIQGRVSRITPFFMELEYVNPSNNEGTVTYRVPMITVLNGQWVHMHKREVSSPEASLDMLPENAREVQLNINDL